MPNRYWISKAERMQDEVTVASNVAENAGDVGGMFDDLDEILAWMAYDEEQERLDEIFFRERLEMWDRQREGTWED